MNTKIIQVNVCPTEYRELVLDSTGVTEKPKMNASHRIELAIKEARGEGHTKVKCWMPIGETRHTNSIAKRVLAQSVRDGEHWRFFVGVNGNIVIVWLV